MSGQYAVYLCDGGPHALRTPHPECPNSTEHAPCPEGYGAWWEWTTEVGRTHRPARCPGCGYFVLLVPK